MSEVASDLVSESVSPVAEAVPAKSIPPRAAIVCIGDELNRGEVIDRNAAWLGEQLSEMGFDVGWRLGVNDIEADMTAALREACDRADVVLVSGGLGPTSDDLTVDVAASLIGCTAEIDAAHEARLRARFAQRKREVPPLALRQVRVPVASTVLPNPVGLAPGFAIKLGGTELFFMPGVPAELKGIFSTAIVPRLRTRVPAMQHKVKTTLRVFGLTEGQSDERLRDLLPLLEPPDRKGPRTTLHYRLAFPEILVSLVTTGEAGAVETRHEELLAAARARLGDAAYGVGDEDLPIVVGRALREAGATVATAESCTGGMIGALLTAVPGSSDYYWGGIISYDNRVKVGQLGVQQATLDAHGAVSQACAEEMATGARDRLGTTYGVAVSGVAGPGGGSVEKPVGTVHIAIAGPGGMHWRQIYWPGEREDIRRVTAITALHQLQKVVRADQKRAAEGVVAPAASTEVASAGGSAAPTDRSGEKA